MAYLFINHYDISNPKDFKLLKQIRKTVNPGETTVEALEFEGLGLINFKLSNILPPDICEDDIQLRDEWTGPRRIIEVKNTDHILYVEFLYQEVEE